MADSTSKIVFAADAAGALSTVAQLQKSLADFGIVGKRAGESAAAGMDAAANAADKSARRVAETTKRTQEALQRLAVETQFGKNSPESIAARAVQKGVPLEAVLDDINRVKLATAAAAAAELSQIESKKAARALAASAELAQVQAVRQARERQAQLDGLTTSLGATGFVRPRPIVPGDLTNATTSLGATASVEQLQALRAANLSAAAATTAVGVAASKSGIQFNEYGLSAKQTAAALRQVPAQLTDIIVSLQGGQAPLTVLLQQGGQLKDVFGGIRPAAAALGRAVLGLINPITIAGAVIGALAFAYKQGTDEADEFAKAIILTGNASGTTLGQLQAMAKGISGVVGSQGQAADALALFAANGNIAGGSLERFATSAIRFERVTGQAISKTVEQFASLAKEPLQASLKLDESVRFLTLSLYQQIKALDEQGRTAEASALAQRALADFQDNASQQLEARLGYIERAWKAAGDAARKAWNDFANVGRPSSVESRLDEIDALLERQKTLGVFDLSAVGIGKNSSELQAERAQLQRKLVLQRDIAAAEGDALKAKTAQIALDKLSDQFLVNKQKREREIAIAQATAAAAPQTPENAAKLKSTIAGINERFKDKSSGPRQQKPENTGKAELESDLADVKRILGQEVDAYRNAESILDAIREAGLADDKSYFAAKSEFVRINSLAQENALIDEIARREVEDNRLQGEARRDVEAIKNRQALADAEERLAQLRLNTSAKLQVLAIQDTARIDALARSYKELTYSVEEYLSKFRLQNEREAADVGKGSKRQSFDRGLAQIEDRGTEARNRLDSELRNGRLRGKEDQYRQELAILQSAQAQELAEYRRGFAAIDAERSNFLNGATRAAEDYLTDIADISKYTENLFIDSFKGMEDALVTFVTTGKLSFKSLADTIVADITRIIIKQQIANAIAALSPYFSGSGASDFLGALLGGESKASGAASIGNMGSSSLIPGFASGGRPPIGRPYLVGENGPEIRIDTAPGRILSTSDTKQALSGNQRPINVSINQQFASGTTRATMDQAAAAAGRAVRSALARGTA